nr:hypothetical protein [Shinella sp. XGS7]
MEMAEFIRFHLERPRSTMRFPMQDSAAHPAACGLISSIRSPTQ